MLSNSELKIYFLPFCNRWWGCKSYKHFLCPDLSSRRGHTKRLRSVRSKRLNRETKEKSNRRDAYRVLNVEKSKFKLWMLKTLLWKVHDSANFLRRRKRKEEVNREKSALNLILSRGILMYFSYAVICHVNKVFFSDILFLTLSLLFCTLDLCSIMSRETILFPTFYF